MSAIKRYSFLPFSELAIILLQVWILEFILLYIPISEIVIRLMNYILLKFKNPGLIPKLDFEQALSLRDVIFELKAMGEKNGKRKK